MKITSQTANGLTSEAVTQISEALRPLRADVFVLYSIGDISRNQRLQDNNDDVVAATDMLEELQIDNQHLAHSLHSTHALCERHNDVATTSLIEVWIDQTERRTWFLRQTVQDL
jgi:starvation-inducible DNA-binding protein